MKRFLILCLWVFILFTAKAKYSSVIVFMADGTQQTVAFDSSLHINFIEDNMVISSKYEDLQFEIQRVKYFLYSTDNVSLNTVPNSINIALDNGVLKLYDLPKDTPVILHDIEGRLLYSVISTGNCEIAADKISAQTIIITVGVNTYKLVK